MFRTSWFVLLLMLCALPSFAQDLTMTPEQAQELAEVQANIERLGLDWTAAPNPVALKGRDYWLSMCGTPRVETDKGPVVQPNKNYPSSVDWTNNNGNWVTPVRNQGGCGSCWIFSSVAGFESYQMIKSGIPGQDIDYAEQFLLSCVPGINEGGCSGGQIYNALDFLVANGVCDEPCFPYQGDDSLFCNEACDDAYSRLTYLDEWEDVSDDIKGALQKGPVMTDYDIFHNFNWYHSGVYSAYGSTPTGGGHAVLIVGYDDNLQAWKAKNSWGPWWGGLGGYFWVAYDNGCGFAHDAYQCIDLNQPAQLHDPIMTPESLTVGESATWSIRYSDAENEPLRLAAVVLKNPTNDQWENKIMSSDDDDYTDGSLFTLTLPLTEIGTYEYFFNFIDDAWRRTRLPAGSEVWQGPDVSAWVNTPPTLNTSELTPLTGNAGMDFTFSVIYADENGDVPSLAQVQVHDKNSDTTETHTLTTSDDDFVAGALFTTTLTLDQQSQYEHRFVVVNEAGQYVLLPADTTQWLDGPSVSATSAVPMANTVALYPPAPNPANPGTNLRFSLTRDSQVDLTLYDAAGRRIRSLHTGFSPAGEVSVFWNGLDDGGRGVPSGIYFARLQVIGQNIKPMVTKVNIVR